ncbi:hypothetical protein NDU88_007679 [Pleurodeles waltl]|uniref:Uncharacterized protein n=1 Tax=Pleurodeles waltl TaxID=8319 RepID=A0AAV7NY26_PLEWA|nr:hypothetical protein NDU88_007679 [Pleurodeles waltl]
MLTLPPPTRKGIRHSPIPLNFRGEDGRKDQFAALEASSTRKRNQQTETTTQTGETEEETLQLKQAVTEDSLGCREPADRAREETPDSTVAREAFCDPSSHASREACPSQVHL